MERVQGAAKAALFCGEKKTARTLCGVQRKTNFPIGTCAESPEKSRDSLEIEEKSWYVKIVVVPIFCQ